MPKTPGQVNFDGYNNHGPNAGKTHDGKDVPPWEKLGDVTRERWEAGACDVKHSAERALLDQLHEIIGDKKDVGPAFERALKRYDVECQIHNGPLALRVLFEIFGDELRKP
jgi:hypothetical protein